MPEFIPYTIRHGSQPVPLPVDVNDAERFPEIAAARAHLASLSPERRQQLQALWESGE